MLENEIENYFVGEVIKRGGVAEKTISLGARGYFDRVALFPGGVVLFAELKRPKGGRLSAHQIRRHARYSQLGARVKVLWTKLDVDIALDEIMTASQ